jgi:hypothetical protein
LLQEVRPSISDIDPLSERSDQGGGIRLVWAKLRKEMLIRIEQCDATRNLASHKIVAQFAQ